MYDCCEYNYTVLEKNAHFPNNYLNTWHPYWPKTGQSLRPLKPSLDSQNTPHLVPKYAELAVHFGAHNRPF